MAGLTRRGFLTKTSIGAAAVGAMLAVPRLTNGTSAEAAQEFALSGHELAGPVVAHVRNIKTGEIAVMVGTREIVFRDRQFVKRLVKAAS